MYQEADGANLLAKGVSRVIERVERGEEIIIDRAGTSTS
jgi:antitoxin (DNA-binding transcriptional repressor) of toxin-antitoxin stability system